MLGGAGRRAHARAGRGGAGEGARVVSWQLASALVLVVVLARGPRLVRAHQAVGQGGVARGHARGAGRGGADRVRAVPQRQAHHRHRAVRRPRDRRGPGLRGGRDHRARLERLLRPGPVDAVADGGLGPRGRARGACSAAARRPRARPRTARARVRGWPASATARCSTSTSGRSPPRTTSASYIAVSGTSFPYNLAHAVGNFVFALAIGPAFVRALRRYRRRFEVRWAQPALIAALAGRPGRARAARGRRHRRAQAASAKTKALRYVKRAQNTDGGFGGAPRQSSSALYTGWVALGIAAAGENPRDVRHGKASPISYTRKHMPKANNVGELERTILVVHAAGLSRAQLQPPQPRGPARGAAQARRLLGGARGPHLVRHPRAARGRGIDEGAAPLRALDGAPAELRRWLRLRHQGRLERRGRHRLGAPGTRGGGPRKKAGGAPGARLPAQGAERRRWLRPAAGRTTPTRSPLPGPCRAS